MLGPRLSPSKAVERTTDFADPSNPEIEAIALKLFKSSQLQLCDSTFQKSSISELTSTGNF